jgi:hypothetical protein
MFYWRYTDSTSSSEKTNQQAIVQGHGVEGSWQIYKCIPIVLVQAKL